MYRLPVVTSCGFAVASHFEPNEYKCPVAGAIVAATWAADELRCGHSVTSGGVCH